MPDRKPRMTFDAFGPFLPRAGEDRRPRLESAPAGWTVPEGWTADNLGHCRSCLAAVLWCYTPAGRKAPANPDGSSHFATCPDGPAWRHKGVRGGVALAPAGVTPQVRVSRLPEPSGGGSR